MNCKDLSAVSLTLAVMLTHGCSGGDPSTDDGTNTPGQTSTPGASANTGTPSATPSGTNTPTSKPAAYSETVTCTGTSSYTFRFNYTLPENSPLNVTLWYHTSAGYRAYIAEAGVNYVQKALAYRIASVDNDGYVIGGCTWSGSYFLYDKVVLVED